MGIEESLKLEEEKFKDRMLYVIKDNLTLSILSFLWNYILNNHLENPENKKKLEEDFIVFWKKNITKITQEQIGSINKTLNEENVDMLNIITDNKAFAGIEDYQKIINESIREVEQIFWKVCGE